MNDIRENLKDSRRGKYPRTPEHKKKISDALKIYYKHHIHPFIGKHLDQEVKRRISDGVKKWWK